MGSNLWFIFIENIQAAQILFLTKNGLLNPLQTSNFKPPCIKTHCFNHSYKLFEEKTLPENILWSSHLVDLIGACHSTFDVGQKGRACSEFYCRNTFNFKAKHLSNKVEQRFVGWLFAEIQVFNVMVHAYIEISLGNLGITEDLVRKNESILRLMFDEVQSLDGELKGFPEIRETLSSKILTIIFSFRLNIIAKRLGKVDLKAQNDSIFVWELLDVVDGLTCDLEENVLPLMGSPTPDEIKFRNRFLKIQGRQITFMGIQNFSLALFNSSLDQLKTALQNFIKLVVTDLTSNLQGYNFWNILRNAFNPTL